MSKRIGVIIENDGEVEDEVLGYINDNPTLFDEVIQETYARYRMEDVFKTLSRPDVTDILGQSTFMYKDQLEITVAKLGGLGKPFKLHFVWAVQSLNDFNAKNIAGKFDNAYFYDSLDMLVHRLKHWVKQGLIYEIEESRTEKVPNDEFTKRFNIYSDGNRAKYISTKVMYSEEFDVFYREGDTVNEDSRKWIHKS